MAHIGEEPIPSVHDVVRWSLVDPIEWLWEEFRITASKQTLSRGVRALGYRRGDLDQVLRHVLTTEAGRNVTPSEQRP